MADYTFLHMSAYYAMAMASAILMANVMRMAMVARAWNWAASSAETTL